MAKAQTSTNTSMTGVNVPPPNSQATRFGRACRRVEGSGMPQSVQLRYLVMVARAEGLIDYSRILTDWIDARLYNAWRETVR